MEEKVIILNASATIHSRFTNIFLKNFLLKLLTASLTGSKKELPLLLRIQPQGNSLLKGKMSAAFYLRHIISFLPV